LGCRTDCQFGFAIYCAGARGISCCVSVSLNAFYSVIPSQKSNSLVQPFKKVLK
jgi:hypothetical protein